MMRKWDITDEQSLKKCIEEVLTRIDERAGSEFGVIAAQEIIDIVANHVGPQAYNTGLEDAKKAVQSKLADLETDLDVLKVTDS